MLKLPATPARRRAGNKTKLTKGERQFLSSQQISPSKVFDASGMPAKLYRAIMKIEDIPFASGTTPCRLGGHRLRTRAGHCIQCDTRKIAYMLRWNAAGHVYVAYSPDLALTKVGFARNARERIVTLNSSGYAGADDWTLVRAFYFAAGGGRIEHSIQLALAETKADKGYVKDGVWVDCNEIYDCSPKEALRICVRITRRS